MKRKLVSILMTVAMVAILLSGCGKKTETASPSNDTTDTKATEAPAATEKADSASTTKSTDGVSITILNTKSEIQTQFEEMAAAYKEKTGVSIEVYVTTGDSPAEDIAKRYASGEAPTLFMGDPQDILALASEKAVDLSGESWAANGGSKYGISLDSKLYSFPFCIEARGLIYNKTAIEKITGEAFDPASVTNADALKALLDKLVAGGMKTPVALNKEDWSLAGHYLTQVYEEQDGTAATAEKFTQGLKAGTEDISKNARFNSLMDTFDLLMQYNMNKADALAADYDTNAVSLAEGDVAFWYNGNWAYANMKDYIPEGSEYGIMPVVQNDTNGNANVNSYLCGGATKQIMIDKVNSTPEQQQAAKDFLAWMVNEADGQDFLVSKCSLIPAFSNISLEVSNPLGASVQQYAATGKIFETFNNSPSDHWKTVGAYMQEYLGGKSDRAGLSKKIGDYWKALK